jgi:hypothetical protein
MANYNRKKPKKVLFVSCCRDEAMKMTGNHPFRRPPRDLRQPQFYDDDALTDPFILELTDYEWEMDYDDDDYEDTLWWWTGEGAVTGPDGAHW